MISSNHQSTGGFKSPLAAQVWFLKRSRDGNRAKRRRYQRERHDARKQSIQLERQIDRLQGEKERLQRQIEELQAQLHKAKQEAEHKASPSSIEFVDPPIRTHGFGARMVDLAVSLVMDGIGLRAVARTLQRVIEKLGIKSKTPSYWAVRTWVQRVGHANLNRRAEKANDWIWLTDHSVQIGKEKALLIVGVRQANLPPKGEALQHQDLRPIAVVLRPCWTGEAVRQSLEEAAHKHGVPAAIVSDHGTDLLNGIRAFQQKHPKTIELYDFKHKAACCLKALLAKDERFATFQQQVSATRNAIQQTELAFLVPPRPKQKARFMNQGPSLRWAEKMLRLLDRPSPKTQQWAAQNRIDEKLGWLRDYRDAVAEWSECQRVINAGVKFANQQGVFHGAGKRFRAALPRKFAFASGRNLAKQLTRFVAGEATKMKKRQRRPLSTEVVESCFGKFKQLEKQHSREGFTSLLLGLPALLGKFHPHNIPDLFARSKVKDVRAWIKQNLGTTLASKRATTYHECKPSTTIYNQNPSTKTLSTA